MFPPKNIPMRYGHTLKSKWIQALETDTWDRYSGCGATLSPDQWWRVMVLATTCQCWRIKRTVCFERRDLTETGESAMAVWINAKVGVVLWIWKKMTKRTSFPNYADCEGSFQVDICYMPDDQVFNGFQGIVCLTSTNRKLVQRWQIPAARMHKLLACSKGTAVKHYNNGASLSIFLNLLLLDFLKPS